MRLLALGFHTQCIYFNVASTLSKCDFFLKLSVNNRMNFVISNKVYFNCLTPFHRTPNGKSATKSHKCEKTYHTLLHFSNNFEIKFNCNQLQSIIAKTN